MNLSLHKLFATSIFTLCTTLSLASHSKEAIELPVTANLGLGLGELHSNIDMTASDQRILAFTPELSGSVSRETLTKYKDKLPKNVPGWLTKADVSYAPYALPTIYFTPDNEEGESVHGFSIGPKFGAGLGGDYLSFGGSLGLQAMYLYIESDLYKENHYITLGASASWYVKFKPIKYLHLELGQKYMQHIERELSNEEYLGRFREDYVMLHFRFPFTTEVNL